MQLAPPETTEWVYAVFIIANAIQVIALAYIAYLVRRNGRPDK
jgi:hypothetical protein